MNITTNGTKRVQITPDIDYLVTVSGLSAGGLVFAQQTPLLTVTVNGVYAFTSNTSTNSLAVTSQGISGSVSVEIEPAETVSEGATQMTLAAILAKLPTAPATSGDSAAVQAELVSILAKLSSDPATQTTAAAILAKLSSDPATQTTTAAILAKLSGDPATQTTAAAILAKLSGDPATQTTLAAVLAKLPAVGPALLAESLPVSLCRKESVTGWQVTTTTTNTNLLDGTGAGAILDVRDYNSALITVVSTATTGNYTIQGCFNSDATVGLITLAAEEITAISGALLINAAITPTAATRVFRVGCADINYLRVNLTVGPTTGTIRAYAVLSQAVPVPTSLPVVQGTASNLKAETVGYLNGSGSYGMLGVPSRLVSAAAGNNATIVKASAGRLYKVTGYNAAASARYLKFSNSTTITPGTTAEVLTLVLPPGKFEESFDGIGIYLATGICYALSTDAVDKGTGALTAGDIQHLHVFYA